MRLDAAWEEVEAEQFSESRWEKFRLYPHGWPADQRKPDRKDLSEVDVSLAELLLAGSYLRW
jgi:hypothetical protein